MGHNTHLRNKSTNKLYQRAFAFILTKNKCALPKDGQVILENCILKVIFSSLSPPLEMGMSLSLNKLEFLSPLNAFMPSLVTGSGEDVKQPCIFTIFPLSHQGNEQELMTLLLNKLLIAYLILAIRHAWADRRRSATYLIMSWNCACITPDGPIEPENFYWCKRREHGDVVVTYISLTIVINPCYLCKQSQLSQVRIVVVTASWISHEMWLNSIVLLDSEHFASFTG